MIQGLLTPLLLVILLLTPGLGAERPLILFEYSPDGTGQVAEFSKKAVMDSNPGNSIRFGKGHDFIIDSMKLWTFEGDGEKVTMYTVGIVGKFPNGFGKVQILLRKGAFAYHGNSGKRGMEIGASKGIDELLLEPGQSYVTFHFREKEEAIAIMNELTVLLK